MGKNVLQVMSIWGGPKDGKGNDPRHPHQIWLKTKRDDDEGIRRAFASARAHLSEEILAVAVTLCDGAQYHFITRLIFRHGDGSYVDTVEEAFRAALKDHDDLIAKELSK